VKVGVVFSQADSGTDPEAIRSWAQRAEAAGFAHILAYDHVLGASVERLGPGPFGPFPTAPYTAEHTFHEILVLFSHLAAVTTTIELATSVLVLPQRQTALAAKQIATVDLLSGGRMRVAVGAGWNFAEYEGLGVDFEDRPGRLEEQIEVVRKLWSEPLVTYRGRYHDLDRVGINPLPSRKIPIFVGSGAADRVLRRVVRVADGWMPLLLPGLDHITVAAGVSRLRQLCEEAGRDPATLPIHGRIYLGEGWQRELEQAVELGFADLSIGFNRLADPGRSHDEHLDHAISALQEIRVHLPSEVPNDLPSDLPVKEVPA
jgi:probable F420-dependent oxidoreductase